MDNSFIKNLTRKEGNEGKRSLEEIVSLNDHGDYLINLLELKALKASPKHIYGDVMKEIRDSMLTGKYRTQRDTLVINDVSSLDWELQGDEGMIHETIQEACDDSYKKYPLVDLGSNGRAEIALIAQRVGVPGVIASDIENQMKEESLEECKKHKDYKDKNYPVLNLNIDMLELLQQLPPNSCNISLFAINEDIIHSKEYQEKLLAELFRVVPEDGIVFGNYNIMSRVSQQIDSKWKDLGKENGGIDGHVFRKVLI